LLDVAVKNCDWTLFVMTFLMKHRCSLFVLGAILLTSIPFVPRLAAAEPATAGAATSPADPAPGSTVVQRIAFVGLHGGVFQRLKQFETDFALRIEYVTDDQLSKAEVDLSTYELVFFQHTRNEDRQQYLRLITIAKEKKTTFRCFSISGDGDATLAPLIAKGLVEHDKGLKAYYGNSPENLRRMLNYISIEYLHRPGNLVPPEKDPGLIGLFHPDHREMFPTTADFLQWSQQRGLPVESQPRVVIAVHGTHLAYQQPQVVAALIREAERQGMLAVAMTDMSVEYDQNLLDFKPHVVIHTCHSRERVSFREQLAVPHLHSLFFRQQSIANWEESKIGLSASEMTFQVTGQEILGAIEPQIAAGTKFGGGSDEELLPVPERIEHLVRRANAWANLAIVPRADKRVAIIYYDREMGKAELMRGSATGMFMNAPRSLVGLLQKLQSAGYGLQSVPTSEDQLLAWMQERGRQIGIWAPGVLDRLARSGEDVLVPLEKYQEWFNEKLTPELRADVIKHWGPPPGKFLVWTDHGQQYITIPRIDLGNVILLPQPLRGEAHDTSLVHDQRVPPPHNYLATYFWLQQEFQAHAMIHFGTHGSEFMLPGKPVGLSARDWPDLVMGSIPNLNPWVLNNLGESSPVRRRAYAVLLDHLVPPSVNAELSDELLNLHNDIDKWVGLEEGALKEKFRAEISRQARSANLTVDLQLALDEHQLLSSAQIMDVLKYLHEIHNETTPVNLHVLGTPPRDDLLIPYLVTCLRKGFIEELGKVVEVPAGEALTPGDRDKFLHSKAVDLLTLIIKQQYPPHECLTLIGANVAHGEISKELGKYIEQANHLAKGFADTHQEIDNLLSALDGRFVPPGPGNSPDRNPSALPTGRNMFLMNPEEVPAPAAWELGKELVDQLLAQQLSTKGKYPQKIGFTLNSFATFQDYGVMESQIFYLLGVRPVWSAQNLVEDVEIIPAAELGRPRVDVFIANQGYYRDMLPSRMHLIDKAIRLVIDTDESEDVNLPRRNSLRIERELTKAGLPSQRAEIFARGRIFGHAEGQYGSPSYYYLVEKSGDWETREDLMNVYLKQARHIYTEGAWGLEAAESYNSHIHGTEIVVRSWSDRTTSPLSNKYVWYQGGSLCLAIQHLTGQSPEFILSDVRDPDAAGMVRAEDALRKDFRVRLFNRKWIEGMMKEGYAGADQIAVHVSNAMGWKTMRPESVADDLWQEIVNVYVRDSKNLAIKEWFESSNPYAYQEMNEVLLETARKGFWTPDEQTLREITLEFVQSVVRHGEGGGLRGGGNHRLESFVKQVLERVGTSQVRELAVAYEARLREATTASSGSASADNSNAAVQAKADPVPAGDESTVAESNTQQVRGQTLERQVDARDANVPPPDARISKGVDSTIVWCVGVILVLVFAAGFVGRRGAP
jgi:cobaltochelatase CobN